MTEASQGMAGEAQMRNCFVLVSVLALFLMSFDQSVCFFLKYKF